MRSPPQRADRDRARPHTRTGHALRVRLACEPMSTPVAPDGWTHVAMTHTASSRRTELYVDGTLARVAAAGMSDTLSGAVRPRTGAAHRRSLRSCLGLRGLRAATSESLAGNHPALRRTTRSAPSRWPRLPSPLQRSSSRRPCSRAVHAPSCGAPTCSGHARGRGGVRTATRATGPSSPRTSTVRRDASRLRRPRSQRCVELPVDGVTADLAPGHSARRWPVRTSRALPRAVTGRRVFLVPRSEPSASREVGRPRHRDRP